MARSERRATERLHELDAEDRAWLAERLNEYRDLLTYLREH
ncbi:MAG TPA: hypothetical protein VGJ03_17300 [Acidimicrobiales bacterium]|jgi:hypothetical protein